MEVTMKTFVLLMSVCSFNLEFTDFKCGETIEHTKAYVSWSECIRDGYRIANNFLNNKVTTEELNKFQYGIKLGCKPIKDKLARDKLWQG